MSRTGGKSYEPFDLDAILAVMPDGTRSIIVGSEVVLHVPTAHDGIVVRVYTSCDERSRKSRPCGTDAVRFVLWDERNDRPVGPRISRVFRVAGAVQRIAERVAMLLNEIKDGKAQLSRKGQDPDDGLPRDEPRRHDENADEEPHGRRTACEGRLPAQAVESPSGEHPPVETVDVPEDAPWQDVPEKFPWPVRRLNPIQAAAREFARDPACNIILATPTNTGKTLVAEMAMMASLAARNYEARVVYVTPMRAIAQERFDSWAQHGHPFSRLTRCILTGDWRLTDSRLRELEASHVVVVTPEMLSVRVRNFGGEKSDWVRAVVCVVFDEIHLVGMSDDRHAEGRGPRMEAAVADIIHMLPQSRLLALSATVPNGMEVAAWFARITGRRTVLVRSDFRPTPLGWHILPFDDGEFPYGTALNMLLDKVCAAATRASMDGNVLAFVHTKRAGRILAKKVTESGLEAKFHCADVPPDERLGIERWFREKGSHPRVLVSTSTTAWGVNLPARHVIIAGVLRGIQDVHPYDIAQMAGRAGRYGMDERGDAWIVIQKSRIHDYVRDGRLVLPPVMSCLDSPGALAFHLVSLIDRGMRTRQEIASWVRNTLFPSGCMRHLDAALRDLAASGAISVHPATGRLQCRPIGRIASRLYLSPYDVAAWRDNFGRVMSLWRDEDSPPSDMEIALAIADVPSWTDEFIPREHLDDVLPFRSRARYAPFKAWCVMRMLRGEDSTDAGYAVRAQIASDAERLASAWTLLDAWSGHWGAHGRFDRIAMRLMYGVPWEMVDLVRLDGIGRGRAKRLWENGFRTVQDVIVGSQKAAELLGSQVAARAVASAERLLGLTRRDEQ